MKNGRKTVLVVMWLHFVCVQSSVANRSSEQVAAAVGSLTEQRYNRLTINRFPNLFVRAKP